jgi:small GTP-binding protein
MGIHDEVEKMRGKLDRKDRERVRIALFGQPGAGKSSLINKLTGQMLAKVGVHTDTTTDAATYEWNGVTLVDLPGYGTKRFPKDTYFERFDVRSFDLFLCVYDGKLHGDDNALFKELRAAEKVCLFVRNQSDKIWQDGKSYEELCTEIEADLRKQIEEPGREVFFTSCRSGDGIGALEKAIYEHLGAAKRERWARTAKAASKEFLEAKRDACETYVTIAAAAAAANALNPIPGTDVALDLGIMVKLFKEIRDAYGLSNERLHDLAAGPLQAAAREVVEFASKQGLLMLLKRFAGRETVKALTKYIPFVGQVIAAAVGFGITKSAGDWYLERCHLLAEGILDRELGARR